MDVGHTLSHLYQHIGDAASGAVMAVVMSAAVRALPEPQPMGSALYGWFYRFTQGALSNYDKLGANR